MEDAARHIQAEFLKRLAVSKQWFEDLQDYEQSQFVFKNPTDKVQQIRIWGIYQEPLSMQKEARIKTGNYPQSVLYNPYTELVYVVNQLSNDVFIYNIHGERLKTITLENGLLPFVSPVDQCLDRNTGEVYVAGSISDCIYVLDPDLNLTRRIPVDKRPVSIALDPLRKLLYTCHLCESRISQLDLESGTLIRQIATAKTPVQVLFRKAVNQLLVLSYTEKSVQLFNPDGELLYTFELDGRPLKGILSADEQNCYVLTREENAIYSCDLEGGTIPASREFVNSPSGLLLTKGGQIAVNFLQQSGIRFFNSELEETGVKETEAPIEGISYHSEKEVIYYSIRLNNQMGWINLDKAGIPLVSIPEGYREATQEYRFQPLLLKHSRITYSRQMEAPVLRIGSKTPGGKTNSRLISLNNYRSPQHLNSQFELTTVENEVIDGKSFWELLIPPEGSVGIILYYSSS